MLVLVPLPSRSASTDVCTTTPATRAATELAVRSTAFCCTERCAAPKAMRLSTIIIDRMAKMRIWPMASLTAASSRAKGRLGLDREAGIDARMDEAELEHSRREAAGGAGVRGGRGGLGVADG